MKLINLITERVQETHFEEFKSWWMEKRNNDEDPINIEFDIEGVDFKFSNSSLSFFNSSEFMIPYGL